MFMAVLWYILGPFQLSTICITIQYSNKDFTKATVPVLRLITSHAGELGIIKSRWTTVSYISGITHLQKHKFVERIIPLHKENSRWHSSTQVLVTIVRVSTNTAFCTSFSIRDFGSECKFARY
jgi:hypothetical protein